MLSALVRAVVAVVVAAQLAQHQEEEEPAAVPAHTSALLLPLPNCLAP